MAKFAKMDDMDSTFASLGLFIVTVITAIAIHGLLLLPLLFFVLTRSNPYPFLKEMLAAMATAFGTASRYEIWYIIFQYNYWKLWSNIKPFWKDMSFWKDVWKAHRSQRGSQNEGFLIGFCTYLLFTKEWDGWLVQPSLVETQAYGHVF